MLNTQIKLHLSLEKKKTHKKNNVINHISFAQKNNKKNKMEKLIIFYSFSSTLKSHDHDHKKQIYVEMRNLGQDQKKTRKKKIIHALFKTKLFKRNLSWDFDQNNLQPKTIK